MTKTKKRSRFFAVALVAVLMLALAVPSFADSPSATYNFAGSNAKSFTLYEMYDVVRPNTSDYIKYNLMLSLYSSRGAYNNCRLSTWTGSNSSDQFFEYRYDTNLQSYILVSKTNTNYALNVYRVLKTDTDGKYYQADIYPLSGNSDAKLYRQTNAYTGQAKIINIQTNYSLTISGRKTASQPTNQNGDQVSYYIDWYETDYPSANNWRFLQEQ